MGIVNFFKFTVIFFVVSVISNVYAANSKGLVDAVVYSGSEYSESTEKKITEFLDKGDVNLNSQIGNRSLFSFIAQRAKTPDLIKKALDKGADPNLKGVYGFTPFMIAAALRESKFIEPFLSSGKVDFTLKADNQENALLFAESNDSDKTAIVKILESKPPVEAINSPGGDGDYLIFRLFRRNSLYSKFYPHQEQAFRLLGELKADFNLIGKDGVSVLQKTLGDSSRSLSFSPENVELLLNCGAKVSTKNKYGDSALHFILDYPIDNEKNTNLLKLFLSKGEDLEVRDKDGNTPLLRLFALLKGNRSESSLMNVLNILLEHNAKTDAVNNSGLNVMMAAAATGCSKCVIRLLEANAPLDYDNSLNPILFYALKGEMRNEGIEALINAGADVNASNSSGMTPLMYALQLSLESGFIDSLIKHGADVNKSDNDGHTPLMVMGLYDPKTSIVRSLLKAGADPSVKDKKGKSALDYLRSSVMFSHPKYTKECHEVEAYISGEKKL